MRGCTQSIAEAGEKVEIESAKIATGRGETRAAVEDEENQRGIETMGDLPNEDGDAIVRRWDR